MANVLRAEGVPFEAQTPASAVRLVSDRSRDDVIEMMLDTTTDPPQPSSSPRAPAAAASSRPNGLVKDRAPIDKLTEDEVIDGLIEELRPWLG